MPDKNTVGTIDSLLEEYKDKSMPVEEKEMVINGLCVAKCNILAEKEIDKNIKHIIKYARERLKTNL